MELIGWFVILPFSLAALLTGLVQSLGTQWELFRHGWILVKFLLTIISVIILVRHMHLVHPAGGLLVLVGVMALSVFKPWGMTPYGRRKVSQADLSSHDRDGVMSAR